MNIWQLIVDAVSVYFFIVFLCFVYAFFVAKERK